MKIHETSIPGAYLLTREPFHDERGSFARLFCAREIGDAGIDAHIKQISLSDNHRRGTLRGLHSTNEPFGECKIVSCTRGEVFDVCVDARPGSPAYGTYIAVHLSAENGKMLYIPAGCAHGFLTLEDDTQILYMMTQFYDSDQEVGYRYDDPFFSIDWPFPPQVISEKDLSFPFV